MGANKLRGKAYADFLKSLGAAGFSEYLDEHPDEISETEKAMSEAELDEYRKVMFGNLPQDYIDADDDDDDDDDYEESYLPEDTGNPFFDSLNKQLNEHDREYWERRKKGIPFEKTV